MVAFVNLRKCLLTLCLLFGLLAMKEEALASEEECVPSSSDRRILVVPEFDEMTGIGVLPIAGCDFLIFRSSASSSVPLFAETFFGGKNLATSDGVQIGNEKFSTEQLWANEMKQFMATVYPVFSVASQLWLLEGNAERTQPSSGCYFGPITHNIIFSPNKQFNPSIRGPVPRSISVVRLLPQARRERIKNCAYIHDQVIFTKLETIPVNQAWPLADGGFLLNMNNELMLRIDKIDKDVQVDKVNEFLFVIEVPPDISGSPVETMARLPILAEKRACEEIRMRKKANCSLQALHDTLLKKLTQVTTERKK